MEPGNINIIGNSLLEYAFCNNLEVFSIEELKHICNIIDYSKIPDRYLTDNPGLYPFINWNRLEKMKAVRLTAAKKELLEKINLKQYQFKVKEIFFLIQNDHTLLFKYFNFDFKKMSLEDAYYLLCMGRTDFLEIIELEKYDFTFIQMMDIIRAYNFEKRVIKRLNYEELKSNQITDILAATGYENLDLFNLNSLTTLDWLELLSYQPSFLKMCDLDKFIKGDPFNLIRLIIMFDEPDLSYLLNEIDQEDITAFGWTKLLIYKTEHFIDKCDFNKLKENHWVEILEEKPELAIYKKTN